MIARVKKDCRTLGLQLAESSLELSLLSPSARAHVDSCLRCQAELAAHRKLRRSLRELRHERVECSEEHLESVLASVGPTASVHALRSGSRRRAYLGGVAAAITAAGAGAVVLAARMSSRSALAG